MSDERGLPWLDGAVLATAYGFAILLVTGDWGKGAGVFCLVALIFVLACVFFPHRIQDRRRLYLVALVVLVGPLVTLKTGRAHTLWHELQPRYGVVGPRAGEVLSVRDIVLIRRTSVIMARQEPFKHVSISLGDEGVYLELRWPQRLLFQPLRIPTRSFTTCRRSENGLEDTTLALPEFAVEIAVSDPEGRVLDWCTRGGIVPAPGD